ncbi:MAG: peptide-methionine (S)-S-oxide reductase MsrA [Cyclobacteriaceae bacterium]|nr:peptide-methionine (S)-S-oxide reductase MsrA [Cyclobacteriaceae bacterium]
MKCNQVLPIFIVAIFAAMTACGQKKTNNETNMENKDHLELATFGAGCFWCVEAIFQRIEGVDTVISGYAGGAVKNPSYKEVCTGTTGHAEVCQLSFDPEVVGYDELLEIFWKTHDPTTLNRQGNDVGTQYRSAVFYHNDKQKELATAYKHKLNEAGAFDKPIVTEIVPYDVMYVAENYHQNYFNQNASQPYCSFVIQPKVDKLEKVFKDKLKD